MDMKPSWDNEEMSDVVLKFGDRMLKCHKLVLCRGSEYFRKMFSPKSNFAECKQSIVELKGDDPIVLELILKSIYTFKYQIPKDVTIPHWKMHLFVMVTADKYFLHGLANEAFDALSKYISAMDTTVNTQEVVSVIKAVPEYFTIDARLEPMIVKLRDDNIRLLIKDQEFKSLLLGETNTMWHVIQQLAGPEINEEHAKQRLGLGEKLTLRDCMSCRHCYTIPDPGLQAIDTCPKCKTRCGGNLRVCWVAKDTRKADSSPRGIFVPKKRMMER